MGSRHLIEEYRVVDVPVQDRSILCDCGWDGYEGDFQKHRKSNGFQTRNWLADELKAERHRASREKALPRGVTNYWITREAREAV